MMRVMDHPSAATRPCDRCGRVVLQEDGYTHVHVVGERPFYCAPCSISVLREELLAAIAREAADQVQD